MFRVSRNNFTLFAAVLIVFINMEPHYRGMDTTTLTVLAAVLLAAIVIAVAWWLLSRSGGSPTTKVGDVCDICFGDLEGRTAVCECGKTFHDDCALPTGSCPYCGEDYDTFVIKDESRSRCLNCGRQVTGDRCRCGAIFPRDGKFVCSKCNAVVDGLVCGKCGTEYVINREGKK